MPIRVVDGGWGDAHATDIHAVVASAYRELTSAFGREPRYPLLVASSREGPSIDYPNPVTKEYVVRLGARDRHWAQFAYQFAHELCHALTNFDRFPRSYWLEETICEVSSLFTLRRMAEAWSQNPPYPNWRSYSDSLRSYAAAIRQRRSLPDGTTLVEWFVHNRDALALNPIARDLNGTIAAEWMPFFEANPMAWRAVGCLNTWLKDPRPLTSETYFEAWARAAPPHLRPFVLYISGSVGISIAPDADVPRPSM